MDKKIIKLVTRGSDYRKFSLYQFQSPNNKGIWKNCIFTFDPFEQNYDWFVVLDNMPTSLLKSTEILQCPKENTIFVTSEPSSISRYGKAFAGQFHYLITNQNEKILPHTNAIRSQTGIYWLYGKDFDNIVKDTHLPKTKLLSTICSDKKDGHTMHKKRYDFTQLMEKEIPEMERFGRGFQFIEKKYQALDDYKFHVVIENHIENHMWSEKLADAFLGFTVPIYCGCPNIYDYFPKDSLIQIDINQPQEAIEIIRNIISIPGEYERRFEAVQEARRKVLYEYNLLEMITNIVNQSPLHKNMILNQKIHSRRYMRARNLDDLYYFIQFRLSNFVTCFIQKYFAK
ncbi:glycosyltransferase family 10 domain-containing protein [Sulfurospirillum sp. UCH001]|uniref:glycosyltransferase family 10 domain-containing protein n=1 Tax=Sulfurospirillum sp. UCH001 TaxID=1581011 RepID=UPI000834BCCD|nr:glycosyltransferase family 10 [Sulfurospirillum sp. UCH001]